MASAVQLLVGTLCTLLSASLRVRAESQTGPQRPSPAPASNSSQETASNSWQETAGPRAEAARETHMVAAGAPASHPLLTLTLVLTLTAVSLAAAFGLRRVFRRVFFRDR